MADSSTLSTPEIIVAKDLRILSKVLRILALIVLCFNIFNVIRGQYMAFLGLLVAAVQVLICSMGESASERAGYIYASLRMGAVGKINIL